MSSEQSQRSRRAETRSVTKANVSEIPILDPIDELIETQHPLSQSPSFNLADQNSIVQSCRQQLIDSFVQHVNELSAEWLTAQDVPQSVNMIVRMVGSGGTVTTSFVVHLGTTASSPPLAPLVDQAFVQTSQPVRQHISNDPDFSVHPSVRPSASHISYDHSDEQSIDRFSTKKPFKQQSDKQDDHSSNTAHKLINQPNHQLIDQHNQSVDESNNQTQVVKRAQKKSRDYRDVSTVYVKPQRRLRNDDDETESKQTNKRSRQGNTFFVASHIDDIMNDCPRHIALFVDLLTKARESYLQANLDDSSTVATLFGRTIDDTLALTKSINFTDPKSTAQSLTKIRSIVRVSTDESLLTCRSFIEHCINAIIAFKLKSKFKKRFQVTAEELGLHNASGYIRLYIFIARFCPDCITDINRLLHFIPSYLNVSITAMFRYLSTRPYQVIVVPTMNQFYDAIEQEDNV